MDIQTIGVVGAGVMGCGVAQSFAQAGFQVILVDVYEDILFRAKETIQQNMRFQGFFQSKKKKQTVDAFKLINTSVNYADLGQADFVIENATERWNVKKEIYEGLEDICPQHTCFGINTSAISITRLASVTKRAQQVVGIHFMNPVPIKPMVEVIRGFHTSEETLDLTQKLLGNIGKESIVVEDAPGFVTNRVMMLTVNEAIFLLHEKVSTAQDIDRLFKTCFGHKMGPLETADLIGLDTVLLSLEVLYESFNDDKYRPCPLLRKMVDAGLVGKKCGQGFHTY